jgi:membrane associated rhomboid family serine protease
MRTKSGASRPSSAGPARSKSGVEGGAPLPPLDDLFASRRDSASSGTSVIKALDSAAAARQYAASAAVAAAAALAAGPEPPRSPRPAAGSLPPPSPRPSAGGATPRRAPRLLPQHTLPSGEVLVATPGRAPPQATPPRRAPSASAAARTPTRDVDRLFVEGRAPPRFICPISGRVMRDPVTLLTGTTCDRASIERHLRKGHRHCPVTRLALRRPIALAPDADLRRAIATWAATAAPWMLDADAELVVQPPIGLESRGSDPQYVVDPPAPPEDFDFGGRRDSELHDPEAAAPGATGAGGERVGRSSRHEWKYTSDGKLVSKVDGRVVANVDARAAGGAPSERATPWRSHRGLASAPRSERSSRSSRSGRSAAGAPASAGRDRWALGFLGLISAAYLGGLLAALAMAGWAVAPMSVNPWYGASAAALADAGALAPQLLRAPAQEWWRLATSIFIPSGAIHLALCLAGLWAYGLYAIRVLPKPRFSVPGIWLISALSGALAAANLNAVIVSAGAAAGVCGLLGAVAADQALHFRERKLWNLREWWLVAGILLVNAAAYAVPGALLPMGDAWFPTAGLLAGFCAAAFLLLRPRVGRGKPGNAGWASAQIACACVVVLGVTAAVAGCALPGPALGANPALVAAACLPGAGWSCAPYGFLPSGCGVELASNGTASVACPGGASAPAPGAGADTLGDDAAIAALCAAYCPAADAAAAALAPAAAPALAPVVEAAPAPTAVVALPPEAPAAAMPVAPAVLPPAEPAALPVLEPAAAAPAAPAAVPEPDQAAAALAIPTAEPVDLGAAALPAPAAVPTPLEPQPVAAPAAVPAPVAEPAAGVPAPAAVPAPVVPAPAAAALAAAPVVPAPLPASAVPAPLGAAPATGAVSAPAAAGRRLRAGARRQR